MSCRDGNARSIASSLLLAAVPPLLVAIVIARYGLNVPLRDQWRFAPDVIAFVSDRYSWELLWRPSGDHRVLVPRAVMLVLASWTHWDVRAEMWFVFALALASLCLLGDLARRTIGPRAPRLWMWLVPACAAGVFSMRAWQSWTFGWMMGAHLAVFGTVLSAWALGRYATTGRGLSCMLAGATLAALSYLAGLLVPVLIPVALVLLPRDSPVLRAHRTRHIWIATVGAVALVVVYFYGYPRASVTRPLTAGGLDIAVLGHFVLDYLGAPLADTDRAAALTWGSGGLIAVGVSTVLAWSQGPAPRRALLPWLLLITCTVGTGVAIGVGRPGPGTAFLSRYAMLSALFWPGVPACVLISANAREQRESAVWTRRLACVFVIAVLIVSARTYWMTWHHGLAATIRRHHSLRIAAGCLRNTARANDECLRRVCRNDPALVRRVAPQLKQLGLGPFRRRE
jgi:hypothetical protein